MARRARGTTPPPGDYALLAWQASWVFALRSAQLWTQPAEAAGALAEMAAEKHRAFAAGAVAAGRAAMAGTRPDLVAAAALRPARRRVAANLRKLTRART
ncbi:antibiotic ABC transporter [Falsiroseomonas bella]|uniref:Antibiotic ABC transporter n=1 Tax=Falsiroseomonas bella TaxID=2184016 RepID=A0A317FIH2_9PROT|nr:antibiotic ABC transporter [Falsiroseomonas bella]PWS37877.1 antibiotic ABC transporter [Falsiroseomonas bella]